MTHNNRTKRARLHKRARLSKPPISASSDAHVGRLAVDELETENNQLSRLAARIAADIDRLRRGVDD